MRGLELMIEIKLQFTNVPVRKLKDYLNTWICVETKAEVVSFTVPPSRLMGCVLELCPTYSKIMKLTRSSGTFDLWDKMATDHPREPPQP